MLEVKIENIVPVTEARDSFNQLVDKVEGSDEMYVLTKNGKPSAILVGVQHLEKLTGTSHEELMSNISEAEETKSADNVPSEENKPVTETVPVEEPKDEPAVTPVSSPVMPPAEPVSPAADNMQNAQDSPFSYDANLDQSVPEAPVVPEAPTAVEVPVTPAAAPNEPITNPSTPASDQFALPQSPVGSDNSSGSTQDNNNPVPPAAPAA